MKKRTIVLIAGALIAAGGAAAIAGVGENRGRFGHGPGMGRMFAHMGGHGFGFRGLKNLDADNDGAVTLEEAVAKRAPAFTRIDTNGDGVVDAQELEAETNLNVEYWTKVMLNRFDANNDGNIAKDEFGKRGRGMRRAERSDQAERTEQPERSDNDDRGWHGRRGGGHGWFRGRRANWMFARFDLNSDDVLDRNEIETAVKQHVTRRGNRMVRRLDQDNDGRITREEFEKPARDRFAMRDIDKDGRITEEDLPPMMRGRGILR